MEMHYDSNCTCPKSRRSYVDSKEYNRCSCNRCCHHDHTCSCSSSCNHCRKDLCSTSFKVRLSGLQGGLNFRLRQLLWSEAEFELDSGSTVKGTIVYVGSNFVEVLGDNSLPEKDIEESLDNEFEQKQAVEKKDDTKENKHYPKGTTWIFSIDKIANVKLANVNHSFPCH